MTDQLQTETLGPDRIVYIRKVDIEELPQEMRDQAGELDAVYAINGETGEPIALVADRRLAFVLARQNDLQPLSVH